MLGTTIGPYRIDAELGAGGMGTVYRAADAAGTVVAIKVVHPHLLGTRGFRERFEREARIGMSIRHSNVVATLACLDVEAGGKRLPALVLEYVEGRSLTDLRDELRRVPEDLCRHLAREIARGLTAIHAAGVVHRDLKPGNVLITPRHEVKVMDLGLARSVSGDDRLSATGVFVGTAAYSPPEQFRGRVKVDPRSDLYSLGAMLYELATGELPFNAQDLGGFMRQVLDEAPRRPGLRAPQLSPFFDELVLRLLAKSPAARFTSASELGEVLDAGERSSWWAEAARDATRVLQRPLRAPRVARETAMWGRDKELALLRSRFARASEGFAQVVLLEGETGIGKSRLVDEFLAGLEGEDVHVLCGGYPPGGDAAAAGAFAVAFRGHFGAASLDDALRPLLAETPLLVPAFAALLRGDAPPRGAEPLTKDSLQTAFVHAARSLASERPLVIVIDDLHFAPQEGRSVFAALALAVPGHRVLLVGTARPGLPAAWVAELERREHFARVEVRRLDEAAVHAQLTEMLGRSLAAEDLARRIAAKADGNPFFVLEILRGLRERGHLSRTADGALSVTSKSLDVEVPLSVRDLVAARLAALAEEDREVLECAACHGHEFDGRLVAEALGRPRLDVLRRLGRLERETSLVRASGARFVFDHHVVHETLYAGMPQPLREEIHAALGDALERTSGAASAHPASLDGALCVELAEHLLKGATGPRALRYFDAALLHLEKSYRNDAGVAVAERALATPSLLKGARRAEVLLRTAGRLDFLGRRDAERALLDEALALADAGDDRSLRARVRGALGWHLCALSRPDEGRPLLRAAIDLAHEAGDRGTEATAVGKLGNDAFLSGRYQEAQELYERACAIARACGDRAAESSSLGNLGSVLWTLGRYVEARERYEESLAIDVEIGNRLGETTAHSNLGTVAWALGRYEEARQEYERGLALAREIGNRRSEGASTGNVGLALRCLGRPEEARAHMLRYLALAQEVGDRRGEVTATGNLGDVDHTLGRLADALACTDRRLELARAIGEKWEESVALQNRGSLLSELGQLERAEEALVASLAVCEPLGVRRAMAESIYSLGELAARAGDTALALQKLTESLALRRDIGDRAGIATSLVALGRLRADAGETDAARAAFDEVVALGREPGLDGTSVLARAHAALLPGGDADAARAAFERHRSALTMSEEMEARYALWLAARDRADLAEAKRLLDFLVANAPEDCRESMLANVPLHRAIAAETEPRTASPHG